MNRLSRSFLALIPILCCLSGCNQAKQKFSSSTEVSSITSTSSILSGDTSSNDPSDSLSFIVDKAEMEPDTSLDISNLIQFTKDLSLLNISLEDNSFATINGLTISAHMFGSTRIVASYGNLSAHMSLVVKYKTPITSITLDKNKVDIEYGDTVQLVPTIAPNEASSQKLQWLSSNESIAKVEGGVITAMNKGKANITVKSSSGVQATCEVNVTKFDWPELSSFATPDAFQLPAKDKSGYQAKAVNEGLFVYAYQYVNKLEDKDLDPTLRWINASHLEMEIWNGDFGNGWNGTYVALWQDKSVYNNSPYQEPIRADVNVETINDNLKKVNYRMFIQFPNNLANPQDGPYAYIKFRFFDANDNSRIYGENDFVEYRDNRFVHTHPGSSVQVHGAVDSLIYDHKNFAETIQGTFAGAGKSKENLTLFIGDSYFECNRTASTWWSNFYTLYSGKNAFTSAIGGTKTWEWLNYFEHSIEPYESSSGEIKNIVIHLGYNDVYITDNTVPAEQIEYFITLLLDKIHTKYPKTKIYYFGIGVSAYFNGIVEKKEKSLAVDALTKAYCENSTRSDYLTFVDTNSIYSQILTSKPQLTLADLFKDGTHPKNEYYQYFVSALKSSGCEIVKL